MTGALRRVGFSVLAPTVVLATACGEAPTTPALPEIEVPHPAFAVPLVWESACDPEGRVGWAMIDGFGLVPLPYCVSATPSTLDPGQSSLFSVASDGTGYQMMSGLVWIYHEGDTLPMIGDPPVGPLGPTGGYPICAGVLACSHAPAASGRVYLRFLMGGFAQVTLWGPVVRVDGDGCSPGAAGVGDGVASGGAQPGPVCPPQAEGRLGLSCESPVLRGAATACQAFSLIPGLEASASQWWFDPDDPALSRVRRLSSEGSLVWGGEMATGGTVNVVGMVGGSIDTVSARVLVEERDWRGVGVDFPRPEPTDHPDMDEEPKLSQEEEGIWDLGHIHYEFTAAYEWRGSLRLIEDAGPNAGMAYLTTVPYVPGMAIHVNFSQLQPRSALGLRHPTSRPAFEARRTCIRSDLPRLIEPIGLHEGTTLHEKSHAGRFAVEFNRLVGPAIESVVLGPTSEVVAVLDRSFAPVVTAAAREAERADSDFKARLGCELNLFPRR